MRAEYDALAKQLSTRRSIDHVRRAAYTGFATFVAGGLTIKFAWDRWHQHGFLQGRPLFFIAALALACLTFGITVTSLWRARQLMRTENSAFARMRDLRSKLGLDP